MEDLSRRERKERIAALAEEYLQFLDEVEPIMSPEELDVFLRMESDPQRDLFIEDFWRRRDSDPETVWNEYRDAYYARRELAIEKYGGVGSDRGKILLLQGEPAEIVAVDHCQYLRPVEIWSYARARRREIFLFYQPNASYVLWSASSRSGVGCRGAGGANVTTANPFFLALEELLNPTGCGIGVEKIFFDYIIQTAAGPIRQPPKLSECVSGEAVIEAVHATHVRGSDIHQVFVPPEVNEEDVRRMLQTSVVSDPSAPVIEAESSVSFAGRRGSRTLVRLVAGVSKSTLAPLSVGGAPFYQIDAVGETLKDGKMFERWQYRFDFPGDADTKSFPVVIERPLRQGKWQLRMKLRDPQSGGEVIISEDVDVPAPEDSNVPSSAGSEVSTSSLSVIRLLPPEEAILTGFQKFEAVPSGTEVAGVEFYLDGTRVMRKMQPPFALELDLGKVPRPHTVRVVALNRRREPLDEDVLKLNDGNDPFRVRIVSPRLGQNLTGAVRVEMEPDVPSDQTLAHVELHLNDRRVATLYGEPWTHTVFLPADPEISVLRAVATLDDPSIRPVEDVVILNGPANLERVDVRLVEVPVTVVSGGHPVQGLDRDAFEIRDAGEIAEIAKFERLDNQPLSIGLAIDSSASMKDRMSGARDAASAFLQRVMTPRDRAFLVSFDRHVYALSDWTSDSKAISDALASLRAEEATALYDAVIESLYKFVGLEGQRALILISDGSDTASRYEWDVALEYARRLAVPIYTIGIGISVAQVEARMRLQNLSESTGGRSWFVADVQELEEPYRTIEEELRSQYLLGFYIPEEAKSGGEWRDIAVSVAGDGQVRTIRGYYP